MFESSQVDSVSNLPRAAVLAGAVGLLAALGGCASLAPPALAACAARIPPPRTA
jgi:hypothetical protein